MSPLAIDLCCGRGTWTNGFLAAGYDVIGFDIERQPEYRGRLVLQDVRTIDGTRLSRAAVIVASPPCDEFSRWQMPWTRAKSPPEPSIDLVAACQRIAREAGAPLILENVRAAQRWLGRATAHLGPVYLWGDGVPALIPMSWTKRDKESHSSKDRLGRASIPPELATWIAACYTPRRAPMSPPAALAARRPAAPRREKDIQRAILAMLHARGVVAWKAGAGAFRVEGRYVRMGHKGVADIIGVLPPSGRLLAIEVKTPDGKLTRDQTAFLASVMLAGGRAFVAHSCDQVARELGWAPPTAGA